MKSLVGKNRKDTLQTMIFAKRKSLEQGFLLHIAQHQHYDDELKYNFYVQEAEML